MGVYSQLVLVVKNSPGLGGSPGEGHGQCCLENPMDREPSGLLSIGS